MNDCSLKQYENNTNFTIQVTLKTQFVNHFLVHYGNMSTLLLFVTVLIQTSQSIYFLLENRETKCLRYGKCIYYSHRICTLNFIGSFCAQ